MCLLFQEFLDEISTLNKVYDCSSGDIVLETSKKVIAKRIPKIKGTDASWCEDGERIHFRLWFSLDGNENKEFAFEMFVNGLKRQKIEVEREDIRKLIKTLYKDKWVKDRSELTILLQRYIRRYIKGYLETKSYILAYCGWKREYNGKEFYSLTKRKGWIFPYIQDMFGSSVYGMHENKEDFSKILLKFNQCKEFYEFLFSNPTLIGIFAYTIHALIWDYGCEYEKKNYDLWLSNVENRDALFFSACLYGKDTDKTKVIANILCNVFNSPQNSWSYISTKHHISATSLKTTVDKLKRYSSVPIIVTSKSNHMMKSSKIVKELYRHREAMKLFVYPVYINDTPINVDEIVNFNMDSVLLPFSVKDKEAACKLYEQMTVLVFSFVAYLRDKSMDERADSTQWVEPKNLMAELKNLLDARRDLEEDWVEKNLPLFLLYAALKFFCDFIKQFQKEEGEKLLSIYRDCIVNAGQTEDSKRQTQKIQISTEQGKRYLLCLNELIQESLKQKEDWLYEGYEPRGEKERCYYMEAVWYDKFHKKVEKEKMPTINRRGDIIAILKQYGFLKVQKTGPANVLKRGSEPKYYYTILADAFTEAVNQWSIPTE